MFKAKVSGTGWLCIEDEKGKLHPVTQLGFDQSKEVREFISTVANKQFRELQKKDSTQS